MLINCANYSMVCYLEIKICTSPKFSCRSMWQCKQKVSTALHKEVIWCTPTAVYLGQRFTHEKLHYTFYLVSALTLEHKAIPTRHYYIQISTPWIFKNLMLNIEYKGGTWKVNIKSQHPPHGQALRRSKNERVLLGHPVTFTPLKKITKGNPFHTFKQPPHKVSWIFLLLNF